MLVYSGAIRVEFVSRYISVESLGAFWIFERFAYEVYLK